MSEELIKNFSEKSLDYINSMEVFAKEQIPDVLQQLMAYKIASHSLYVASGIILFLLVVILLPKIKNETDKNWLEQEEHVIAFGIIIAVLLSLLSITLIINNIDELLMAVLAPKVYIIEWLKGL